MVGRGNRLHEDTQKYKFWVYDYTGVTELFGSDFLTADPTRRSRPKGGEGDDEGGDPALVVEMPLRKEAQGLRVEDAGRMVPVLRQGRQVLIGLVEYRAELAERLRQEAGDLDGFRSLWIEQREGSTAS